MYIAKNTNARQSPLNEQDEGFATVNVSQAGTACVYGPMHSRHAVVCTTLQVQCLPV